MKAIYIAFLLLASMPFLLSSTTLAAREVQPIKGDPYNRGARPGKEPSPPPPPPRPNTPIGSSRGAPAFGNNPYGRGGAYHPPPPNPVASVANRNVYGTTPPNPTANTPYRGCINNPYTRRCSPPNN
ncbi:hypothetical protein HN51_067992 [Arachis hypogaea]|uniref:uncharacterized protein n=1 Tax=Arachis hypogaea TaxID=3818 RepID=UPI000A2B40BB|nr:formin-like protein 5 isoform X3 [Arachis ipaensis]XP_025645092.1 formin-like protein 5 [Arachis hypogaea]QHO09494.1 uncharacterized protein DS421_14g481750 [Arachis hypogaea]